MVKFVIMNGAYIAQTFTTPDADTCISWQPIGRYEDVHRTIHEDLIPAGMVYEIEEQKQAIDRLKEQYSGMEASVIHDNTGTGILGMPVGWCIVNIKREDGSIKLQAGVSPEGRVAT